MERLIAIPIAIPLLVGLLLAERNQKRGLVLALKTPLSCLFVVTALIQPHPNVAYFGWVLAGLILGLIGDVCLALPGERTFKCGVVAFLAGHVMYILALAWIAPVSGWYTPGLGGVIIFSVAVFWWLRPHVGSMIKLVAIYVVVISLMLIGAWGVFFAPGISTGGEWIILGGALLFYVSDLFVARDRFVKQEFLNRLFGLPMYYGGQFMLAISVGLVA